MSLKEFIEQELSKLDTKEEKSTGSLASLRKPRKKKPVERKPIKRKTKAKSASPAHGKATITSRRKPARKQRIKNIKAATSMKKGGY